MTAACACRRACVGACVGLSAGRHAGARTRAQHSHMLQQGWRGLHAFVRACVHARACMGACMCAHARTFWMKCRKVLGAFLKAWPMTDCW